MTKISVIFSIQDESSSDTLECDSVDGTEEQNETITSTSSSLEDTLSSGHNSFNSDESNNSLVGNILVENDDELVSTTETIEEPKVQEATQRKTFPWTPVEIFHTYAEAQDSLIAEKFTKHGSKSGLKNTKTNYRCGKVKQKSKVQCDAKRRIVQNLSTTDFVVESNGLPHTCGTIDACNLAKSISKEMKEMIVNCAQNHMTPKYIISHIDTLRTTNGLFLNEETPNIASIYYILKVAQMEKTPKILYLGELIEWAEMNMDAPDELDKPFVIGMDHSDEDERLKFRLVVTTKRLLQHCTNITHLCVDATYKLTWHDFPFMVIGTVDMDKKFHPLCFALCTNETQLDFEFVFEALSNSVKEHTDGELKPDILISDASNAIRNAFMSVFPLAVLMIMCYVHVLRNVAKHKEKYSKANKNEIFRDIEILHQSSTETVFKILSRFFIKKWKKREPEFARYFKKQWMASHCNWFLGAAAYTPTTNNAVEGEFS